MNIGTGNGAKQHTAASESGTSPLTPLPSGEGNRTTRRKRLGFELAYYCVERDFQRRLVGGVGFYRQVAAEWAVGGAVAERDCHLIFLAGGDWFGGRGDGGAAAR